ncbi:MULTISPECIES: CrcB family protein [unclassified Streptomyces]|uniref:fluoride efflux transporter FluC n=1 Tax=unclassified Streptomyces TaxID=2593676 RepID=UPI0009A11887|nr:CrcB family protein [Streptomyces sp. TSRI0281]
MSLKSLLLEHRHSGHSPGRCAAVVRGRLAGLRDRLPGPHLGRGPRGRDLLLGFSAEAASDGDLGSRVHLLVATGFRGALSTWSTFSYELLTPASTRRVATAGAYLFVSVGAGVGLSFAGAAPARAAW